MSAPGHRCPMWWWPAADRPQFLATVCGVLALHSVSVRTARVATRSDGLVLDAFTVEDALGTGMIGPARWPAIRTDLGAALRGDSPAGRAAPGQGGGVCPALGAAPNSRRPTVGLPPGSGRHGVIEVRTTDRLGLLYDVCRALATAGLDVHRATVDTLAGQAIDVFHVSGLPEDVEELRRTLERDLVLGSSSWMSAPEHRWELPAPLPATPQRILPPAGDGFTVFRLEPRKLLEVVVC